jgi:hypothetical protein
MRAHSAGRCGADTMQWRRNGERATARAYTPSVLVTMGMLILLSLGEDIFEIWGEVRADWVAAAILWGGDVGVVSWRSLCRTRSGLDLFLHTTLSCCSTDAHTLSTESQGTCAGSERVSAIDYRRSYWTRQVGADAAWAQRAVAGGWERGKSRQRQQQRAATQLRTSAQQRNRVRQMRGIGPFRSEVSILLTAAVLVAVVSDCRISIVTSSP